MEIIPREIPRAKHIASQSIRPIPRNTALKGPHRIIQPSPALKGHNILKMGAAHLIKAQYVNQALKGRNPLRMGAAHLVKLTKHQALKGHNTPRMGAAHPIKAHFVDQALKGHYTTRMGAAHLIKPVMDIKP